VTPDTIMIAWVTIGTALFLGAVAIFGPFLLEPIKRALFGPRIRVVYDHQPPLARLSGRMDAGGNPMGDFFDFHIRIENESRWVHARRVEAVLEGMWIYDAASVPQPVEDFLSIRLRYDGRGTEFVDINPQRHIIWNLGYLPNPNVQQQWMSVPRFVDVPGASGNAYRFYLDVFDFPFHQPNRFVPGRYGILVAVHAENARCVRQHFEINWTGTWQPDVQNVVREIVIEPRDRIRIR